jgi:hypothetical protein
LVNGDTLAGGLATGANAASDVGAHAITQGTLAASSNYAVSYVPGVLSVTPRALTITADDAGKLQGAGAPADAGVGLNPITATAPVGIRPGSYAITLRPGKLAVDDALPSQGAQVRVDIGPVGSKERAPATRSEAVPLASPWVDAPEWPADASPRPAGQAE